MKGLASSVKLCSIFIDSISALIRHQYDDNVVARQQLLLKYAQQVPFLLWVSAAFLPLASPLASVLQLKILAQKQSLPVVVTNQITGSSGDSSSSTIASLGTMWVHQPL